MDKHLITQAFEKLGPEKVRRMLVACVPENGGTWHCCALAHAYGRPGDLSADLELGDSTQVGPLLGLTVAEASEISVAHYWKETTFGQVDMRYIMFPPISVTLPQPPAPATMWLISFLQRGGR